MAVQTVNQLKQWFQTRDKPTQQQFWDWLDSFVHRSEGVAIENVGGLLEALQQKADVAALGGYSTIAERMILAATEADLLLLSHLNAFFVLVENIGVFAAVETPALPNYEDTFPSLIAGWLWKRVLVPGAGGGGGMLRDVFVMNADYTYTLAPGYSIDKIKTKPDGAETFRAGRAEGAQDVILEETFPGGTWHTTSIDIDADSEPVDIFFTGVTGNVSVIIYKREL